MKNNEDERKNASFKEAKESFLKGMRGLIDSWISLAKALYYTIQALCGMLGLIIHFFRWVFSKDDVSFWDYEGGKDGRDIGKSIFIISFMTLAAVIFICGFSYLHKESMRLNQSYIDKKIIFNIQKQEKKSIGLDDEGDYNIYAFKGLFDAQMSKHPNDNVILFLEQSPIAKEYSKGINFVNYNDFISFLYSRRLMGEFGKAVLALDSLEDQREEYLERMKDAAKNEYVLGNYYSSSEYVDLFFRCYSRKKVFPVSSENNDMHLLKLFLQPRYRWLMTTNKKYANWVSEFILKEARNLDELEKIKSTGFEELNLYIEGVSSFEYMKYKEALDCFIKCSDNTDDDMLKQYCAMMAIRCAFWEQERSKSNNSVNHVDRYDSICNIFSKKIEIPYFYSDLGYYDTLYNYDYD